MGFEKGEKRKKKQAVIEKTKHAWRSTKLDEAAASDNKDDVVSCGFKVIAKEFIKVLVSVKSVRETYTLSLVNLANQKNCWTNRNYPTSLYLKRINSSAKVREIERGRFALMGNKVRCYRSVTPRSWIEQNRKGRGQESARRPDEGAITGAETQTRVARSGKSLLRPSLRSPVWGMTATTRSAWQKPLAQKQRSQNDAIRDSLSDARRRWIRYSSERAKAREGTDEILTGDSGDLAARLHCVERARKRLPCCNKVTYCFSEK